MSVLKIRNENGEFVSIPAIKGDTPVKGTDYFTEADKAEIVEEVTAQLNADVQTSDSIPDYWYGTHTETYLKSDGTVKYTKEYSVYLDEKIAEIKKLQQAGGRNCFSFVVMTDMHYESNLAKLSPTLAKKIMDECGIKFCLCLGDTATRHGANHDEAYADNEWAEIEKMFAPIRDRLLITQGNHDGSYDIIDLNNDGVADDLNADGEIDSYDKNVYNWTPQKLYENIFRKVSTIDNVNFSSDGSGYYVDDKGSRVRYILLNTHVNKWEQNEDSSMKYNNMYNFRFGQSQYDMVIEALQTVPSDDWCVIVGSHVPLDRSGEEKYFGGEVDENNALLETSVADCTLMQRMLNAYCNKSAYAEEFVGSQGSDSKYTNHAVTTSSDWAVGNGIGSSGVLDGGTQASVVTNYIKANPLDVIRIKNFTCFSGGRLALYDADKNYLGVHSWSTLTQYGGYTTDETTGISTYIFATTDGKTVVDTLANAAYVRLEMTTPEGEPIITVNEEIVENTGGNFDAVSVDVDFTEAKGQLIAYFAGHLHEDKAYPTTYSYNGAEHSDFYIITSRSDGRVENTTALMEERVAGTITEQSFDVFTINTAERRIYATKIGAGVDRGKDTAITY